jgi:Na+-transporting NADH:ubiquinone oxidoreductase subunit F
MLFDMVNRRYSRKARFFFGAKSARDLFRVEEMREFEKKLPDFKFFPALSEPESGDNWTGERGLITEVVDRHLPQGSLVDAYLCGSPMMVNGCIKLLKSKGIPDSQIFYDKFV